MYSVFGDLKECPDGYKPSHNAQGQLVSCDPIAVVPPAADAPATPPPALPALKIDKSKFKTSGLMLKRVLMASAQQQEDAKQEDEASWWSQQSTGTQVAIVGGGVAVLGAIGYLALRK